MLYAPVTAVIPPTSKGSALGSAAEYGAGGGGSAQKSPARKQGGESIVRYKKNNMDVYYLGEYYSGGGELARKSKKRRILKNVPSVGPVLDKGADPLPEEAKLEGAATYRERSRDDEGKGPLGSQTVEVL